MKKLATVLLLAFAAAGAAGCRSASAPVKPKLMWLDCSANWERFSYPDSIRHYVRKCREAGMTALVLDIKGTSSEVVYPSEYAPRLKEWKGVRRPTSTSSAPSPTPRMLPAWKSTARSTPSPKATASSAAASYTTAVPNGRR